VLRTEVILTVLITCAIAIHNNPHFKQEIFSTYTILDYATDCCETCHYDNAL